MGGSVVGKMWLTVALALQASERRMIYGVLFCGSSGLKIGDDFRKIRLGAIYGPFCSCRIGLARFASQFAGHFQSAGVCGFHFLLLPLYPRRGGFVEPMNLVYTYSSPVKNYF